MKAVLQTIRILVITQLVAYVRCQDGFSDRDLLRLQQIANEGQMETITSYSTNIMQRDPNGQSISAVSVYHMTDEADKNEEYNRADRGRSRKVYRIKNPFQQADEGRQENAPQDTDSGASNQYSAMQYSLPPEEFLQQMRAENQYYQQQQSASTPSPSLGYTATPQPYQYSTIAASGYDNNNPQQNQIPQLESKMSNAQTYRSISNSYQFGPNSYSEIQSTPSPIPPYLSTPNNYVGTPANYVSSSSPIYLSSPQNLQQYISSSISAMQAGTPDYSNKATSTIGSNSLNYDQDQNKKMQIDHYDNSVNGIRYPINVQNQYQNEYPTSTPSPSSTPYPDPMRDSWQNAMSANAKSLQEASITQYQKYPYNRNPQDNRNDLNAETSNIETHRVANMPSANNLYLNFMQPDYQALSNLRSRTRDLEHETSQPEFYSHGEYGWKLNDRKPLVGHSSGYSSGNYPRYQALSSQNDNVAISQMSFHMDTGKPYNYNHISKSSTDSTDHAQEFAKAAAKAHENQKRQQLYESSFANYNGNSPLTSGQVQYYNSNNEKQRTKYDSSSANPFYYGNSQQDLITASPYYYTHSRENVIDDKPKQPFDHDKALKTIVPIDVSNVVGENQQKIPSGLDGNNRYSLQNYKEQIEQNVKQNYKTIADSYYQDKNAIYGFNIKPKQEEQIEFKFLEPNGGYYSKQPTQEQYYHANQFSDKRYADASSQPANYVNQVSNNYQDSVQASGNVQQQGLQRQQNQISADIANILKLNDIPYRLTQGLPAETYRLHNGNYEHVGLPATLPARLNQNVGSHQLDVTNDIINKLVLNKQPALSLNRPDIDQTGNVLSTINGFKVANPFNVDLKLVAEMLKGKQAVEDTLNLGLRDPYNRPAPLKLDISQIHQLLSGNGNQGQISDGLGAYSSPYLDVYNTGRYPYQGVKYSRSQEEEESIVPIADASNTHPIGAVVEQDDAVNGGEVSSTDLTAQDEDNLGVNAFGDSKPKHTYRPGYRGVGDRHRHPNSLLPGRNTYQRKYPKADVNEPYPLLKPPPPQSPRGRGPHSKLEKHSRRRRVRRPKVFRMLKTEPLFEADSTENAESEVPIVLRPPPPIAEAKSDVVETEKSS